MMTASRRIAHLVFAWTGSCQRAVRPPARDPLIIADVNKGSLTGSLFRKRGVCDNKGRTKANFEASIATFGRFLLP